MSEHIVEGVVMAEDELPARDLVPYSTKPVNLFGADSPAEVVEQATRYAKALADVIRQQHLYKTINNENFVKVEGWTLLGSMLGVFAVLDDDQPEHVEIDGVKGWRATVTAQTRGGDVVGRATALCLRSEKRWRYADDYAIASMAQTRATSKALRAPLGFIIQLAGFSPTPESELPAEGAGGSPPAAPSPPAAADVATAKQHRRHNTLLKKLEAANPQPYGSERAQEALDRGEKPVTWTMIARDYCVERFGKASRSQLTEAEMDKLIEWTEWALEETKVPFGNIPPFIDRPAAEPEPESEPEPGSEPGPDGDDGDQA